MEKGISELLDTKEQVHARTEVKPPLLKAGQVT
jgi:hypothetical protein